MVQGEPGVDAELEGTDGAQGAVVAPHSGPARAGQSERLRKLLLRRRKLARELQVSCLKTFAPPSKRCRRRLFWFCACNVMGLI